MFLAKFLCVSCAVLSVTAFAAEDSHRAGNAVTDEVSGLESIMSQDGVSTMANCYTAYGNTISYGNGVTYMLGDNAYSTGDSREACGDGSFTYKFQNQWIREIKRGGLCWNLPGTPTWYSVVYCKPN